MLPRLRVVFGREVSLVTGAVVFCTCTSFASSTGSEVGTVIGSTGASDLEGDGTGAVLSSIFFLIQLLLLRSWSP